LNTAYKAEDHWVYSGQLFNVRSLFVNYKMRFYDSDFELWTLQQKMHIWRRFELFQMNMQRIALVLYCTLDIQYCWTETNKVQSTKSYKSWEHIQNHKSLDNQCFALLMRNSIAHTISWSIKEYILHYFCVQIYPNYCFKKANALKEFKTFVLRGFAFLAQ
jgi:hypothetical protein